MFQEVTAIIRGSYVPQKLLKQYLCCGCIWITIRPVFVGYFTTIQSRVFKKKGPEETIVKNEELMEIRVKLHGKELHNLYFFLMLEK
jgi:hypothetical protein